MKHLFTAFQTRTSRSARLGNGLETNADQTKKGGSLGTTERRKGPATPSKEGSRGEAQALANREAGGADRSQVSGQPQRDVGGRRWVARPSSANGLAETTRGP